jgi:hypothetical protein
MEHFPVVGTVQTAWLFTRDADSVRIVRAADPAGTMYLLVQGPADASEHRCFDDVVECMNYQADLERRLVADGYSLERFTSERRAQDSSRGGQDRRRMPHLFL